MIRLVELLVAINAACGIMAFIIARGLIARGKKKLMGEDPPRKELP